MPSRADLRLMIGEEAGVIAAGETLQPADQDYIDRRTESRLAELYDAGLTPFDIEGTIPQAYMLPLARVIAAEIAPGFGMNVPEAESLAEKGMRALRRLKAEPYAGETQRATYY